jgi:hypothetical protein
MGDPENRSVLGKTDLVELFWPLANEKLDEITLGIEKCDYRRSLVSGILSEEFVKVYFQLENIGFIFMQNKTEYEVVTMGKVFGNNVLWQWPF